jgi:small subunit ribosomal protein S6
LTALINRIIRLSFSYELLLVPRAVVGGVPTDIGYQEKGRKEKENMRYYETLYIINPNLAEEGYSDVVAKFNALIEKDKGVIVEVDEWGKKNLAYEVKKFDKGHYVLVKYCGDPQITKELRREFKLDERVLKYQTIKLSDSADPEALKREAEEGKEPLSEEPEATAETPSEVEEKNGE